MKPLEEPYRSRAVPPGTTRYWSWLFAARGARPGLLGVYALTAEWQALRDPALERGVAQLKLAWWNEEMRRAAAGSPLHPVTRYLRDLPSATAADFEPLGRCVAAALEHVAGVPLERRGELQGHADALYGVPLRVAAALDGFRGEHAALQTCLTALAGAEYLARSVSGYAREMRAGRIPFPVADLLAAQIDNEDLAAEPPSPRLRDYLSRLRREAAAAFATAATALAPGERAQLRHLPVLARLGAMHLNERAGRGAGFRFTDLYNAWQTARRATAVR